METIYSYLCNPLFSATVNELGYVTPEGFQKDEGASLGLYDKFTDGDFKDFAPPEGSECATSGCTEYIYSDNTDTNGFTGRYGIYPSRGYVIDFTNDRVENIRKIKRLYENDWIDQDTRSIQMCWTVKSAWS